MISKTTIVIITYNPNINNLNNVLSELNQVYHIVVSDNASQNIIDIKKLVDTFSNTELISSPSNAGIASAQNKAIRKVLNKAHYVFFLDQDSYISIESLRKLEKDMEILEKSDKEIGSVSAVPEIKNTNSKFEKTNEVISSGMLVPVSTLRKVGLMKDDFFIDMVDYEWCWRALKKGYSIYKDNQVLFNHQIGTEDRILGKIPIAPFRLYYVYRNTFYLLKKDYLPKNYAFKLRYGLFKQFIFNVVFCPNKDRRIRYILKGIKDGKSGKLGKIDE